MRTLVHGHRFPNTRKQMEAGNLTDVSILAIGWVTHISMKTVVYFNQSKNILYHDYQQLVTFLTVQSPKTDQKITTNSLRVTIRGSSTGQAKT